MGAPKPTANTDPSLPLATRLEAFCAAVLAGKSQVAAYRDAYPSSRKWAANAAESNATTTAALPQVKARIQWLREQAASKNVADLQELLEYHTKILRACPGKLLNEDGTVDVARLAASGQEIESIQVEDTPLGRKTKFTLRDGIAAARELARLQGFEKPVKVEHSGVVENRWTVADIREG